jgi:ergothioneine biosynthesis protein EgtB
MLSDELDIANPKTNEEFNQYYSRIRSDTEKLAQPLEIEDYMLQAMTTASPTKWHLAHVSWFYEAFILKKYDLDYKPLNELYNYLFNSYYQDVGSPWPRPQRGNVSRPTVAEVYEFRRFIDDHMKSLLDSSLDCNLLKQLIVLGGNHEQQHQELILTDIKYNLSINPLFPKYSKEAPIEFNNVKEIPKLDFVKLTGGLVEIGNQSYDCFAFDNEGPVKKEYINDYKIGNRLIVNGEYLKFIEAGGYNDPKYWLSEGWDQIVSNRWKAPLHWHNIDGEWYIYTLHGLRKLNIYEPVSHISYFEADAFAKFMGKRLPTEAEWENTVRTLNLRPQDGNFRENRILHTRPVTHKEIEEQKIAQMYGDVWEWTSSAYSPYPGFSVLAEGISEYNGKFMSSQFVMRGGSFATPRDHIRPSYRNFWHPDTRFQFTGIRLAE